MHPSLLALPSLLVAACSIEGHFYSPTVQVSPDGDDANDGHDLPVRTLRRGIDIATADTTVPAIAIAAGRYNAASGETFPYTVPANVTLSGPTSGGTILAGSGAEPGLIIGDGELRDLELEDFTVAVTSRGTARLENLRVRSSRTAVRGEAASRLTVTKLTLTGVADMCATGIGLHDDAALTASEISVRALGMAFQIDGRATASISKADITGVSVCRLGLFAVGTTGTFALDESIVDDGWSGINFSGAAPPTTATLTGTTLRNLMNSGLSGDTVKLTMTDSELSRTGSGGVDATGGTWILDRVTIKQNQGSGARFQNMAMSPMKLVMRDCTILDNRQDGVFLNEVVVADLGTAASPGNNTLQGNLGVGLNLSKCPPAEMISAVGNTWRPNVQNANGAGRYLMTASVSGPVMPSPPSNYTIATGCTLQR